MQRHLVLLASLVLFGISSTFAANWAVLVAGSNEWYNYRHQADVCHAYQILHKHNIPDSNIIVMMYDDIAQNTENPTKGVIINHPNGQDVYHGVPKDYTGDDVTPTNFLNVLLGKKDVMRGIGSGKVLESGPDDNVFIFYSDHGAVGLVAFPAGGYLYATDLNKTITQMYNEKKYKQLVIYLEACESGSMLDTLPTNMNIYATTASNPEESSYACYFDATRQTYLGDLYSVNWMEDSDAENINTETLFQQFAIVRDRTNLSHVMQYGDLTLGQSHHVSEFQAENAQVAKPQRNLFKSYYNQYLQQDAVPTVSVRMSIVSRRLAAATDEAQKQALQLELVQLLNDQATIADKVHQIASKSLGLTSGDYFDQITQKHMKFTQHDCYKSVTQHMEEKCFDLANEFALNKLYVIANLCQIGLYDFTIKNAVDAVCQERLSFKY